MAWIKIIQEDMGASPFDSIGEEMPEVISVFSLRPELLRARVAFGEAMTFGGSGLGRYREELIAVSISQLLGCKF